MSFIFVTCKVFQSPIYWLKFTAWRNMRLMSVTWAVFHSPISRLKAVFLKIWCMSVTFAVSHLPMSWLNFAASQNMLRMVVTCDVFHFDISPLNSCSWANPTKPFPSWPTILVIRDVSQLGIVPYFFVFKPYSVHRPSLGDSAKQLEMASEKDSSSSTYSGSKQEVKGPASALEQINFAWNAVANENIWPCAFEAAKPCQFEISWSKADALMNIRNMLTTRYVSQPLRSWLKAEEL